MKITLLMAMTADGLTARTSDEFVNWTESEDKGIFVEVTKKAGVVIMGRNTYNTIGKPLKDRKNIVYTRKQIESVPEKNLYFTDTEPPELIGNLESEGFSEAVLIGGSQINTLFAENKLIDELILTLSPLFFGKGINMFTDKIHLPLEMKEYSKIGKNSLLVKYKVLNG